MENRGRKILLAMDGSEHSDQAYQWYLKYFRQPEDYVLFVYCPEISQAELASFFTKSAEEIRQAMIAEQKEVKLLLSRLDEHLKREGISGKTVTIDGDPKEVLANLAEKENVDCIITGSRGWSKARKSSLGSVSSYLVHHAKVPVMIVKKDR